MARRSAAPGEGSRAAARDRVRREVREPGGRGWVGSGSGETRDAGRRGERRGRRRDDGGSRGGGGRGDRERDRGWLLLRRERRREGRSLRRPIVVRRRGRLRVGDGLADARGGGGGGGGARARLGERRAALSLGEGAEEVQTRLAYDRLHGGDDTAVAEAQRALRDRQAVAARVVGPAVVQVAVHGQAREHRTLASRRGGWGEREGGPGGGRRDVREKLPPGGRPLRPRRYGERREQRTPHDRARPHLPRARAPPRVRADDERPGSRQTRRTRPPPRKPREPKLR